jgi:hypothetical protein
MTFLTRESTSSISLTSKFCFNSDSTESNWFIVGVLVVKIVLESTSRRFLKFDLQNCD